MGTIVDTSKHETQITGHKGSLMISDEQNFCVAHIDGKHDIRKPLRKLSTQQKQQIWEYKQTNPHVSGPFMLRHFHAEGYDVSLPTIYNIIKNGPYIFSIQNKSTAAIINQHDTSSFEIVQNDTELLVKPEIEIQSDKISNVVSKRRKRRHKRRKDCFSLIPAKHKYKKYSSARFVSDKVYSKYYPKKRQSDMVTISGWPRRNGEFTMDEKRQIWCFINENPHYTRKQLQKYFSEKWKFDIPRTTMYDCKKECPDALVYCDKNANVDCSSHGNVHSVADKHVGKTATQSISLK